MRRSAALRPAALTATRSCPGPGVGSTMSLMTICPCSACAARISAAPLERSCDAVEEYLEPELELVSGLEATEDVCERDDRRVLVAVETDEQLSERSSFRRVAFGAAVIDMHRAHDVVDEREIGAHGERRREVLREEMAQHQLTASERVRAEELTAAEEGD